jgi:hypothetical protein
MSNSKNLQLVLWDENNFIKNKLKFLYLINLILNSKIKKKKKVSIKEKKNSLFISTVKSQALTNCKCIYLCCGILWW